jgi:hypothetical protein
MKLDAGNSKATNSQVLVIDALSCVGNSGKKFNRCCANSSINGMNCMVGCMAKYHDSICLATLGDKSLGRPFNPICMYTDTGIQIIICGSWELSFPELAGGKLNPQIPCGFPPLGLWSAFFWTKDILVILKRRKK